MTLRKSRLVTVPVVSVEAGFFIRVDGVGCSPCCLWQVYQHSGRFFFDSNGFKRCREESNRLWRRSPFSGAKRVENPVLIRPEGKAQQKTRMRLMAK